MTEHLQKLVLSYKRYKLAARLSVIALALSVTLFVIEIVRVGGYRPMAAEDHLGSSLASSGNGLPLTVLTSRGRTRNLLLSIDSGAHFSRVFSWQAEGPTRNVNAMAIAPDHRIVLVLDSPFVRLIPTDSDGMVSIRLPDTLFRNLFDPLCIRFQPHTTLAYIFRPGYGLCIVDWTSRQLKDVGQIPNIDALTFDNTGSRLALEKRFHPPQAENDPGIYFDSLYIGPDIGHLTALIQVPNYLDYNSYYWITRNIFFDSSTNKWLIGGRNSLNSLTLDPNYRWTQQREVSLNELGSAIIYQPPGPACAIIQDTIKLLSASFTPIDMVVLKYASRITSMAFYASQLTNVMIQNERQIDSSTHYYLMSRQFGWGINPIYIKNEPIGIEQYLKPVFFWLFLFGLFGLIGFVVMAKDTAKEISSKSSSSTKEDALLPKSEHPLGPGDKDLLGFDSLATPIVDLIRNPQTDLPFTIVVSGSWGSGKSSMMNLVREKLRQQDDAHQYYTTWFNAWHMQNESHLLDSFLLHLVNAYERNTPYIFSPFRLTLAVKRFFRLNWLNQLALGLTLAMVTPWVLCVLAKLIIPTSFIDDSLPIVNAYWKAQQNILSTDFANFSPANLRPYSTISAVVIGILSIVFLAKKFSESGLSAFVKLLPRKPFNVDVESRDIGYRDRFKKEYWQIMDSAKQGSKLVVFIDDIDRIPGYKVLELLEAINFVSDTASVPADISKRPPNTIFILGMFIQEVAQNLGNQLLKQQDEEGTATEKILIGSKYIEKMVQLIIPVPFDDKSALSSNLYANSNEK